MKPAAPEAARQQVEDTGFSAVFEKLIITVRAQLYTYKTIRANNGRESENTANHKYMTSSIESAPARSAWKQKHLSLKLTTGILLSMLKLPRPMCYPSTIQYPKHL